MRCGRAEAGPARPGAFAGLALALCLVAPTAAAPAAEPDAQAVPEVVPATEVHLGKISFVPIRSESSLRAEEDGSWRYDTVARTRGWAAWKSGEVAETSRFALDGDGLRPLSYRKRDGFSDRDRNIETRFVMDEAVSLYRGKTLVQPVDGRAYDLLSFRLALRLDLAADRLASHYNVIDARGRLRRIEVRRLGGDAVRTGLGEVDAERLEYVTRSDRRYVIWFAPALDHALVRFEEHRDGRLRAWLVLDSMAASSAGSAQAAEP